MKIYPNPPACPCGANSSALEYTMNATRLRCTRMWMRRKMDLNPVACPRGANSSALEYTMNATRLRMYTHVDVDRYKVDAASLPTCRRRQHGNRRPANPSVHTCEGASVQTGPTPLSLPTCRRRICVDGARHTRGDALSCGRRNALCVPLHGLQRRRGGLHRGGARAQRAAGHRGQPAVAVLGLGRARRHYKRLLFREHGGGVWNEVSRGRAGLMWGKRQPVGILLGSAALGCITSAYLSWSMVEDFGTK